MKYTTYNIGGCKIGGDLSTPTLLISSIFYSGHNIVSDQNNGEFDVEKAKALIDKQIEVSQILNIPTCLDVVGETAEAMAKYLPFVAENFDGPIVIDGFINARMEGLKVAKDLGIMDRVIYNSIWKNQPKELDLMKETGLKTSIVFSYDVADSSAIKRFKILTEGTKKYDGLFSIAEKIGVKQLLIDNVLTTELNSLADVLEANLMFKSLFGYPVGCGPANINYGLSKSRLKFMEKKFIKMIRESAVNSIAQLFSDFILIGPIERIDKACVSADLVNTIRENLNFDPFEVLKQGEV